VTTNGDITRHLIWRDPGFDMAGDQPVYVWIAYDAAAHTLTLFAGQTSTRPAAPLWTYPMNLRTLIGNDRAYAGFTGGTGLTNLTDPRESILSWSYSSS
jgi:Legume lectin domain